MEIEQRENKKPLKKLLFLKKVKPNRIKVRRRKRKKMKNSKHEKNDPSG